MSRVHQKIRKFIPDPPNEFWRGKIVKKGGSATVSSNPLYCWVRPEGGGQPLPIYNDSVPHQAGRRVKVGRDKLDRTVRVLHGIYSAGSDQTTNPNVGPHANSHAENGVDPVWITDRQITPLLVWPTGGMSVKVYPGWITYQGQPVHVATTTIDLTTSIPGAGARYSLIRVSSTGAISVQDGTPVDSLADLSAADIPECAAGYAATAFVRLYFGQTALSKLVTNPDVKMLVWGGGLFDSVAVDASDATFTPAVNTDWDGDVDPGNVDDALDQLGERVDDLEGGFSSSYMRFRDLDESLVSSNFMPPGDDRYRIYLGPALGFPNDHFDVYYMGILYTIEDGIEMFLPGIPPVDGIYYISLIGPIGWYLFYDDIDDPNALHVAKATVSGGGTSVVVEDLREEASLIGTTSAADVPTATASFDGLLSAADDTVQKALDTLDDVIVSGSLLDLLNWYDAKVDGGLAGDGVTDDTSDLQTLINTATANGTKSATIYFPPGKYLIGGALQDTGDFNGQILLPEVPFTTQQIVINFIGATPPPTYGTATSATPMPGDYFSIIKSTLTGATGTAALISGGTAEWPADGNNLVANFKKLIFETPTNPTFTVLNLGRTIGNEIEDILIYTGTLTSVVEPTHSNSYGLIMPQYARSNYQSVKGLLVDGFYNGYKQGELAIVHSMRFSLCKIAVEIPFAMHASKILYMQTTACQYPIRVTGSHYCDISLTDAEHFGPPYPSWYYTVYDLDDPNNNLHGEVGWVSIYQGGANDHTFTINGGSHTIPHEVGTQARVSPSKVYDPASAAETGVDDAYTKALLHMNGTDTSTTFTDESGKTWTAAGAAQIDTAQSKFGGAAGLFAGGATQYISTPDHADFYFDGDFTIDLWIRPHLLPTSTNTQLLYTHWQDASNVVYFFLYGDGQIYFQIYVAGAMTINVHAAHSMANDNWYHIALARNGNVWTIYKNGILVATSTDTDVYPNLTGSIFVGDYFNGWVDELRVSKGIARWTSNFTPESGHYGPLTAPQLNVATVEDGESVENQIPQWSSTDGKLTAGFPVVTSIGTPGVDTNIPTEKAVRDALGGGDAADVTYTPAVLTDWNTDADPGDVDNALDQLAERVDDLEGGAGHSAVTLAADADTILSLSTQEISLDTQTANRVLAGPTTGAAADPTFRALVAADVGTGAPSGAKYLRDDMSWQSPAGAGDVVGPASATDGHLALFDGVTGKLIKDGGAYSAGTIYYDICNGRLTLETAVPVSSTDQTAKTTLYFTPYRGNLIGLYDGASAWTVYAITEKSLDISGYTANKNYDIWMYDNAGTPTLDSTIWTNDTTRATALALQDGILVKNGATTRRYLGTIRITGTTGQCEDSLAKRFVWNFYNQVSRPLSVTDATASWTYATATWREARAQTTNLLQIVVGVAGQSVEINVQDRIATAAAGYAFIGIGKNATNNANVFQGINNAAASDISIMAKLVEAAPLGYTYYVWVEYSKAGSTTTFYGSPQGFITGRVEG